MLCVVHEANQNEFSAALAFKLPLLKTHILSPDSHGRPGVKLSLSSDIVGIRKHIHSQLRQVPSPYSALLELFRQVTNPVGYHMPIMIHCIIVTLSSHYLSHIWTTLKVRALSCLWSFIAHPVSQSMDDSHWIRPHLHLLAGRLSLH